MKRIAGFLWLVLLPSGCSVERAEWQSITVQGNRRFEVVQGKRGWRVTAPAGWPASRGRLQRAVRSLQKMVRSAPVGKWTGDPSRFGFDDPAALVRIRMQGKKTVTVAVGDELAGGRTGETGYYWHVKGRDGLYIAPVKVVQSWLVPCRNLLSHRVFRFAAASISKAAYRKSNGRWQMLFERSSGIKPGREQRRLLENLLQFRAERIMPSADPQKFGLVDPDYRLLVETLDSGSVTVLISKKSRHYRFCRIAGRAGVFRIYHYQWPLFGKRLQQQCP